MIGMWRLAIWATALVSAGCAQLFGIKDTTGGGDGGGNGASLAVTRRSIGASLMTAPQDLTGQTCDALSLGIGFTADPALLGTIVPTPQYPSICYPEGGAPDAQDKCQ